MLESSQVKDTSSVFDLDDEKNSSSGALEFLSPKERSEAGGGVPATGKRNGNAQGRLSANRNRGQSFRGAT